MSSYNNIGYGSAKNTLNLDEELQLSEFSLDTIKCQKTKNLLYR